TAEAEAEKPTRKPPARKTGETAADVETDAEAADEAGVAEAAEVEEAEEAAEVEEPQPEEGAEADEAAAPAKKKTRRGSRGGRNRRKPAAAAGTPEAEAAEEELAAGGASEDGPEPPRVVTIHVPAEDFAREDEEPVEPAATAEGEVAERGEEPGEDGVPKKKRTRGGTRGGRKRRTPAAPSTTVTARVVGHVLGDKIRIGKYRRRTGYRRHNGHRSRLTQIEIETIGAARKQAATAETKARAPEVETPAETAPAPEGYEGLTVAQISPAVSGWDRPELEAALAY